MLLLECHPSAFVDLRIVLAIIGPELWFKLILFLFPFHFRVKVVTNDGDLPPFPVERLDVPPVYRIPRSGLQLELFDAL